MVIYKKNNNKQEPVCARSKYYPYNTYPDISKYAIGFTELERIRWAFGRTEILFSMLHYGISVSMQNLSNTSWMYFGP